MDGWIDLRWDRDGDWTGMGAWMDGCFIDLVRELAGYNSQTKHSALIKYISRI